MFTDIHTHILFNVDDGAKTKEESLEMLKQEKKLGVTDVILTPHYIVGRNRYTKEDLYRKREILQKETDIRLHLGNECLYSEKLAKHILDGSVLPLGETNLILVEFEPYAAPLELYNGCLDILNTGRRIVLAHIERYSKLSEQLAEDLLDLGVEFQMNYGFVEKNLLKPFASGMYKTLLKKGDISYIASDAHNSTIRCPNVNVKKLERKGIKIKSFSEI